MYKLTNKGKENVAHFINECEVKRKAILLRGRTAVKNILLPTEEEIERDLNHNDLDDDGTYLKIWYVADQYYSETTCLLMLDVDFVDM